MSAGAALAPLAVLIVDDEAPARERLRDLLPHRADVRAMRRNPRRDLLAGVTVAFVALLHRPAHRAS